MGMIFDIQRGCTDDGPGIRTTVFLKGCPLNCLWCHNPESKSPEKQEYADGSGSVGYQTTPERVMETVLADSRYYKATGGGMTISGGEPLMQPEFSFCLLQMAKEAGIHTCIETSGFAGQKIIDRIFPVTDLFLFDIKAPASVHKELTGVSQELIMQNFRHLYERGAKIILRCPIIPTKNDTEEHFSFLRSLKKEYPSILGMELMPYHNMGIGKARRLGMEVPLALDNPSREQIRQWESRCKME